ncbi:MAG: hypothetical protein ABW110_23440 [Steroidobacteraceae bacterium]
MPTVLKRMLCLCTLTMLGHFSQAGASQSGCEPADGMEFVCGPRNTEDLVQLSGTDVIIASSFATPGTLYWINAKTREWDELYPKLASAAARDSQFPDCAEPPNPEKLTTHGLSVQPLANGRFRLLVTGHGAREAVEAFEVDAQSAQPKIRWNGCVLLPEKTFSNSSAPLPDGGFIVTKTLDSPTDPNAFERMVAAETTGALYEWRPGKGLVHLQGGDLPGANGVATSADGQHLYVAAWGSSEVVKLRLQGTSVKIVTRHKVPMRPDNLRWSADGRLLAAGQILASPTTPCTHVPCVSGWAVTEIDPETLASTTLIERHTMSPFNAATVALALTDYIWLGSFHSDRIAIVDFPVKRPSVD